VAAVGDDGTQFALGRAGCGLALFEQLLGEHTGLNAGGELNLLGCIEQWGPGDLVQVHADEVAVGLAAARTRVAGPVGLVADDGTGGHAYSFAETGRAWLVRSLVAFHNDATSRFRTSFPG
jgi:hypothetical protein